MILPAFTQSYEESQLHDSIYQLHVKLLGSDKSTVISEYSINPTEDRSNYSHTWKEVSYPALGCATWTCMHLFFLIFVCVCLCWPAGFACVFWLWTWGEICPFSAPAEEHVFEWLFQHHVYWQLSGCQTNQNKPLTSLLRAWSSNTFVLRLMHKVWNIIKCKSRC